MTFVLLYGPPAAGKLTVAQELAKLTGFKLFDNHLSIDLVEAVFPRGTPSFSRAIRAVRQPVLEEAARENVSLISTYVYAHPRDIPSISWMLEAVEQHGGRAQLVQLFCRRDQLTERVGADSRRTKGKISDVGVLCELLETYDLFTPYPDRPSLQLDTTDAPPSETAAVIAAHLGRDHLSHS